MEIRHILAATDFSERADHAVTRAALLAQQHGAELHLLHSLHMTGWDKISQALTETPIITERQLFEAAQERLKDLAATCSEKYGVNTSWHVDIGAPHDAMISYVKGHSIDLSVLGAHAENFAHDLFVGTTALKFIQRHTRTALIAHVSPSSPYQKVLVATDFSDSSVLAVQEAMTIAPTATIYLLNVYDVMFEGKMRYAGVVDDAIQKYRAEAHAFALREMDAFINANGLQDKVTPMVLHGDPANTILDEAAALRADLIVMGKRGQSGLEQLLIGSVTENVLIELDCDLLLVNSDT